MCRVLVLGGGVSGLSTVHYLNKRWSALAGGSAGNTVHLVEKTNRTGGWLQSFSQNGYFGEVGPRSIRVAGGEETLSMISDLNLSDRIVIADPNAKKRWILHDNKVRLIPTRIQDLIRDDMIRSYIPTLLKEPFAKRGAEDESIHQFCSRRLGRKMTDEIIAAVVHGIYGGSSEKLSVLSCFPSLKSLETEHGSLLMGSIKRRKQTQISLPEVLRLKNDIKSGVYSFKGGLQELTDALEKRYQDQIHLNSQVVEMVPFNDKVQVTIQNTKTGESKTALYSHIISTLPSFETAKILKPISPTLSYLLNTIYHADLVTLNLNYSSQVLPFEGFGYLCPPIENQKILGVVMDSCTFPQHNPETPATRLTVMLGGDSVSFPDIKNAIAERNPTPILKASLEALHAHLGIRNDPVSYSLNFCHQSIPQYYVGHSKKLLQIQEHLQTLPWLTLLGQSYQAVGINAAINNANKTIQSLHLPSKSP